MTLAGSAESESHPEEGGVSDSENSLLARAFNGPVSGAAEVSRRSWLEDIAEAAPEPKELSVPLADPTHFDTEVSEQATDETTGNRSLLVTCVLVAALTLVGFTAGVLVARPATEKAVAVEQPVASSVPPTIQPAVPPEAPVAEPAERNRAVAIEFEAGSMEMSASAVDLLEAFATEVDLSDIVVLVGSGDANLAGPLNAAVGELRAQVVADGLARFGVRPSQVVVTSPVGEIGDVGPQGAAGAVLLLSSPASDS